MTPVKGCVALKGVMAHVLRTTALEADNGVVTNLVSVETMILSSPKSLWEGKFVLTIPILFLPVGDGIGTAPPLSLAVSLSSTFCL